MLADVVAQLIGLLEQVLLGAGNSLIARTSRPADARRLTTEAGTRGVPHRWVSRLDCCVVEQCQNRLGGAGSVPFVAGEVRRPRQREGGPGLAQVLIALHHRVERRQVAGLEATLGPVHAEQPVGAALHAQVHLLLQRRVPG